MVLMGPSSRPSSGSSLAVIEAVKVTVAGTYLILVRDHYGQYAGAYGLTVITNPGPNPADEDGSEILAGEYKTADIAVGDIDVYSYQANAGDVLTIFVGVTSGSLDPQVELHGPDGARRLDRLGFVFGCHRGGEGDRYRNISDSSCVTTTDNTPAPTA